MPSSKQDTNKNLSFTIYLPSKLFTRSQRQINTLFPLKQLFLVRMRQRASVRDEVALFSTTTLKTDPNNSECLLIYQTQTVSHCV